MKEELYIENLDILFIKKDFISSGNKKKIYDYEDYVLEWINNSRFVKDNGECLFQKIPHKNQSDGECDLKNKQREFELKMMVDSYTVKRKAHYSSGIHEMIDGVICHTASEYEIKSKSNKDLNKKYETYWLIKIFRKYSYLDFLRVDKLNKEEIDNIYDRIIKDSISKIKKDKDIIYYFPVNIYYKDKKTTKRVAMEIINAISMDLNSFMEFRTNNTNKDTFFCLVSKEYIIFAIYSPNGKFEYYDMLKTNSSKIFEEIKDINTIW